MQVFLSYARAKSGDSRAHVRLLEKKLREEGFSVYLDEAIAAGERWCDDLQRHLRICSALVAVYPARVSRTRWVFAEAISRATGR